MGGMRGAISGFMEVEAERTYRGTAILAVFATDWKPVLRWLPRSRKY